MNSPFKAFGVRMVLGRVETDNRASALGRTKKIAATREGTRNSEKDRIAVRMGEYGFGGPLGREKKERQGIARNLAGTDIGRSFECNVYVVGPVAAGCERPPSSRGISRKEHDRARLVRSWESC